jgi:hypothetical protein
MAAGTLSIAWTPAIAEMPSTAGKRVIAGTSEMAEMGGRPATAETPAIEGRQQQNGLEKQKDDSATPAKTITGKKSHKIN